MQFKSRQEVFEIVTFNQLLSVEGWIRKVNHKILDITRLSSLKISQYSSLQNRTKVTVYYRFLSFPYELPQASTLILKFKISPYVTTTGSNSEINHRSVDAKLNLTKIWEGKACNYSSLNSIESWVVIQQPRRHLDNSSTPDCVVEITPLSPTSIFETSNKEPWKIFVRNWNEPVDTGGGRSWSWYRLLSDSTQIYDAAYLLHKWQKLMTGQWHKTHLYWPWAKWPWRFTRCTIQTSHRSFRIDRVTRTR